MANYKSLSPNGVGEARRGPRVELMQHLHGQLTSIDLEIAVREISLGGLSFEAAVRFPAGAVHEFRLTLGDGSTVLIRGKVAYSRPAGDAATGFVTGIEFLEEQTPPTGEALLDHVTSMDAQTARVRR